MKTTNDIDLWSTCCLQDWTTLINGSIMIWYYDMETGKDKVAVIF